jgi:CheY-like chemotaxis protein
MPAKIAAEVETALKRDGAFTDMIAAPRTRRGRACLRPEPAAQPGLRSFGTADGDSALAAFRAASRPFDLLLTDLIMPGVVNGKTLADEVKRRWPDTRIIFMTGYAEDPIIHHGRLDAGVLLLNKPFRKSELALAVRQVLDGTSGPGIRPPP